jgi:4-aminobutyrate aminotransferase-like enzyme
VTTDNSLTARRDRALGAGMPLFYREPLHLVRGEGAYLFDTDARRYVDLYNNVPCVGHGNARVAEAMSRQQSTLNVHSRYLHEGIVEFAERLAGMHGDQIESVVFACSGTEAIEVALQMARTATGNRGIIGTNATYHGNSNDVIGLTRAPHQPGTYPEIRSIPFPERLRPIACGLSDPELADAYLAELRSSIDSLKTSEAGFAAVIFCSILANEGLPDVPEGFMARTAEIVHNAGGLMIADEVQAGYGRTGQFWGYDVTGFQPDIVVTGKPMGNGLPLSATAASRDLVERFRATSGYFNTFASSPLQAAVGMAVLDEIEDRGLLASVTEIGANLKADLAKRLGNASWLGDVRGHGLFVGVEIVSDKDSLAPDKRRAIDIINHLKDLGFLTSNAGAHNNVVKIRPPLVFSSQDATDFLVAFDQTVADIGS